MDNKFLDHVSLVVSSTATMGMLRSGKPPSGSGPAITVTASDGTSLRIKQIQVTAPSTYSALAVAVQGIDGYFELAAGSTSENNSSKFAVYFAPSAPRNFNLQVSGGTASGYGTSQSVPVQVEEAYR
jgi:hypothetical protein